MNRNMEARSGSNMSPNPVGTPVFRVTTRTGPSGPVPNPEQLLTIPIAERVEGGVRGPNPTK
jgi:hypothetical protein